MSPSLSLNFKKGTGWGIMSRKSWGLLVKLFPAKEMMFRGVPFCFQDTISISLQIEGCADSNFIAVIDSF